MHTRIHTGADVILTDIACQLDLCAKNIAANGEIIKKKGGKATVAELDWTKPLPEGILEAQPFDVILCSDVLSHVVVSEMEAEFLKTLDNLCGQHTVVLHVYEPRLELIINEYGAGLLWHSELDIIKSAKNIFEVVDQVDNVIPDTYRLHLLCKDASKLGAFERFKRVPLTL